MARMDATQHLAVHQVKGTLLRECTSGRFLMRGTVAGRFMCIRVKRCNRLMGMPARMTQGMGQRALLGHQQENRQQPSQGDGAP